ncbi:hypothetical protein [Geodermatophilus sp. SYSU D00815]
MGRYEGEHRATTETGRHRVWPPARAARPALLTAGGGLAVAALSATLLSGPDAVPETTEDAAADPVRPPVAAPGDLPATDDPASGIGLARLLDRVTSSASGFVASPAAVPAEEPAPGTTTPASSARRSAAPQDLLPPALSVPASPPPEAVDLARPGPASTPPPPVAVPVPQVVAPPPTGVLGASAVEPTDADVPVDPAAYGRHAAPPADEGPAGEGRTVVEEVPEEPQPVVAEEPEEPEPVVGTGGRHAAPEADDVPAPAAPVTPTGGGRHAAPEPEEPPAPAPAPRPPAAVPEAPPRPAPVDEEPTERGAHRLPEQAADVAEQVTEHLPPQGSAGHGAVEPAAPGAPTP